MILSFAHRFVFIRGRKVAGTSVEMALSTICGPDDIVTPLIATDERVRQQMGGRCGNYSDQPVLEQGYVKLVMEATPAQLPLLSKPPLAKYTTHMSLKSIVARHALDGFRIVCVERSPYARVLSALNTAQTLDDYDYASGMQGSIADLPRLFDEALAAGIIHRLRNIDLYKDASGTVRARALRYETLRADFDAFAAELGIAAPPTLPHAKKGRMANDLNPLEVLRHDQVAAITAIFAEEFDAFGYPRL